MPFTFRDCQVPLHAGQKDSPMILIEGLKEVFPKVFTDNRGYFLESYNKRDFVQGGIPAEFAQDNQSASVKGVLRGLHFQKRHPQGKLVRALEGKVYDVAVDLRRGSPAFSRHYGVILDSDRQNQFYIPPGFAHGFFVISEKAVFAYKCTDFYHPEDEGGLMWNDPVLNIDWKSVFDQAGGDFELLLSEKDKKHQPFNEENNYFDVNGCWIGD